VAPINRKTLTIGIMATQYVQLIKIVNFGNLNGIGQANKIRYLPNVVSLKHQIKNNVCQKIIKHQIFIAVKEQMWLLLYNNLLM